MTTTALAVNKKSMALPVVTDDLNSYLAKIAHIDLLSVDEEQTLARRLRDEEDLDAARRLVMSQLRFVVHVARSYKGYGLPMSDLVQEGNIGLMKAVKRFDPDVGVRLISFAVHWIRAEIHEFVIKNWRIVKVATTKAQRKLFFKLRSAKKEMSWFSQDEVNAVAEDLNVAPDVVVEMESRMHGHDTAFDAPPGASEERVSLSPVGRAVRAGRRPVGHPRGGGRPRTLARGTGRGLRDPRRAKPHDPRAALVAGGEIHLARARRRVRRVGRAHPPDREGGDEEDQGAPSRGCLIPDGARRNRRSAI